MQTSTKWQQTVEEGNML